MTGRHGEKELIPCVAQSPCPRVCCLAAATRVELAHPRLQDECSVIQLSYAAIWWTGRDSNPHKKFAGLLCCRLHHQPIFNDSETGRRGDAEKANSSCPRVSPSPCPRVRAIWWLWVESNHQPRAYETLALIPLELHSQVRDGETR